MGYTTKFDGEFRMDRLPPAEVIVDLRSLEDLDTREVPNQKYPGNYCQWVLTKDCQGLNWDGNEKFDSYQEWLQWIIDNILKPHGITLTGTVTYAGEDVSDHGTLSVVDGKVVRTEDKAVADDLEELRRFKDFVRDWMCHKKTAKKKK